jgi:DNA-binding transcriptional regulator GbsR (MarR family)
MSTQFNSISPRRAKILDVLEEAGEALQIREIVDRTGLDYGNARSALSEMTSLNLVARVHRGVYDLPKRVEKKEIEAPDHPLNKILLNQQILKVLLNIVITNKALMEALLLGQQEIIQALRTISPENEEGEEAIKNLEEIFAKRVEWHFDIAAEQVAAQYTKLPEEVFDVLVAPLTRDKDTKVIIDDLSKLKDKAKKTKSKKSD